MKKLISCGGKCFVFESMAKEEENEKMFLTFYSWWKPIIKLKRTAKDLDLLFEDIQDKLTGDWPIIGIWE